MANTSQLEQRDPKRQFECKDETIFISVLNALCLAQRIGTFIFWLDSSLKILYKEREKCFLVLKTSGGALEL